jgi:glucose/arabinose dehydrogenase
MTKRRRILYLIAVGLVIVVVISGVLAYRAISSTVSVVGILARGEEGRIRVPEGFEVGIFAEGLDRPRFMNFGIDGKLYVAERKANRIVTLEDTDGDGRSDSQQVFADEVEDPHSIVFYQGAWYVGVPTGVIRFTDLDGDGQADERETLIDSYPTSGHNTRTVEFLPDGRMVVSVGSSCNVCEEQDPRRAAVLAYENENAEGEHLFASGLRNAVGLTLHPATGELWVTNNGRDLMGDDIPPETVYLVREGADYGWPRCHSGRIEDPDYGYEGACDGVEAPIVEMQAHSAPLGLVFYEDDAFPEPYRDDLFIAFHGSWNRSVLTGYKIVRLPFDGNEPGSEVVDFATGWLEDDLKTVTGRPVGLAVGPDGALYISDDTGGFIYRISYEQDPDQEGVQVPQSSDVLAVRAVGEPHAYDFAVEISSPDTGCNQYADWWEVVSESGELIYRRTLLHSHVSEQPFTRSGGPVSIDPDAVVIVRAHMHPGGYGGRVMKGSVGGGFAEWESGSEFALELEQAPPQPPDCGF